MFSPHALAQRSAQVRLGQPVSTQMHWRRRRRAYGQYHRMFSPHALAQQSAKMRLGQPVSTQMHGRSRWYAYGQYQKMFSPHAFVRSGTPTCSAGVHNMVIML
jgi:hypothetical protein